MTSDNKKGTDSADIVVFHPGQDSPEMKTYIAANRRTPEEFDHDVIWLIDLFRQRHGSVGRIVLSPQGDMLSLMIGSTTLTPDLMDAAVRLDLELADLGWRMRTLCWPSNDTQELLLHGVEDDDPYIPDLKPDAADLRHEDLERIGDRLAARPIHTNKYRVQ